MVGEFGAQPDDGCILVIQPLAFLVALGKLQSFLTPQAFHLLVIDLPTRRIEQFGDHTIAVTAILLGQPDHLKPQLFIVLTLRAIL